MQKVLIFLIDDTFVIVEKDTLRGVAADRFEVVKGPCDEVLGETDIDRLFQDVQDHVDTAGS